MTRRSIRRHATGFTTFEVFFVVIILGVMLGVAGVPDVDGSADELSLLEVQLSDAVSYAKSLARSSRKPYGLKVDPAADAFAVIDGEGLVVPDPRSKQSYVVSLRAPGQANGLDFVQVDFGTAGAPLMFDPHGDPLAGGVVTVRGPELLASFRFDAATGNLTVR